MRALTIFFATSIGLLFAGLTARADETSTHPGAMCKPTELVTKFGERFSPSVQLDSTTLRAQNVVPSLIEKDVIAVRLLIAATLSANAHWRLVLRAPSKRTVAVLTPADFSPGASSRWTGLLDTFQVSAELSGAQSGDKLEFRAGVAEPRAGAGSRLFSIQGNKPNWKPLYSPDTSAMPVIRAAGNAVGIFVANDESFVNNQIVSSNSCCTGVMVARDVFMTNWHCGSKTGDPSKDRSYWDQQYRTHAIVDLGWTSDGNRRLQYNVTDLLDADKELDYVLLEVAPVIGPGAGFSSPDTIKISLATPISGDSLFIIHHAQCLEKSVSFANCRVLNANFHGWKQSDVPGKGTELTNSCDTEPGASGAPVLDASGNMIALHHLGFVDGNGCKTEKHENKAVLISSIVDHIGAETNGGALLARLGWK